MLDIKFVRENPELVKENIRKKFQDHKLPLVDEVVALDRELRDIKQEVEVLRAKRNKISKQIGALMGQGKRDEAEQVKAEVANDGARIDELTKKEGEVEEKLRKTMMVIPQIIDPSVPIGKDDSENVEVQRYGEPVVPDFEIPYHTEIMELYNGIDLDSARRVAGNGFYYLMGDIARLHSAVISYARDFMIDRGFTYCVPPFMIRSDVVTGVMSFAEMEAMMYKIEGEDLYLIGTSEHSMIGKFIDQILPESSLPQTLTSYSPCFRKEKGAHGIEERGVYRIHQFEKQEMIVICKPEDSPMWFDKLWQNTVDLFRSLEIPVRTLECCSGDLADLKVKSVDVEAWSPRQKKYFEVGSCSNLGDAQARRLKIRVNGEDGKKYLAHTLNNTVVAPPRMLIAFLENHLQADGTVTIPGNSGKWAGGILSLATNATVSAKMVNCLNTGVITCGGDMGGLAGGLYGDGAGSVAQITFEKSANLGKVLGASGDKAASSFIHYVGYTGRKAAVSFTDCYALTGSALSIQPARVVEGLATVSGTITELDGVDVYAYSGYNQYNGGAKIADWVNEKTGGKAVVAIIDEK